MHLPDNSFHHGTGLPVISVNAFLEMSETAMICILAYFRDNYEHGLPSEKRCVALLLLAETKGVTLLSRDVGEKDILDIAPNDFGYFVVVSGKKHCYSYIY